MKSELTSQEILVAFKNQDWPVLERLIKQYTDYLLKGAYSLGFIGSEADDLVQNVWSTFFEILPRFEGNSQIKTFYTEYLSTNAENFVAKMSV